MYLLEWKLSYELLIPRIVLVCACNLQQLDFVKGFAKREKDMEEFIVDSISF